MMIQKRFSLYFVLGIIIVLIASFSVAIISSYSYFQTKQNLQKTIHTHANDSLEKLSKLLIPYIESYSATEYTNILRWEMKNSSISAVVIEDYAMGKVLGVPSFNNGLLRDTNWDIVNYDQSNNLHKKLLANSYYSQHSPIVNKYNEKIAQITIYSTDKFMQEQLDNIIKQSVIFTILISLVLIVLSFILIHGIIIRPLEKIITILTKNSSNETSLKPIPQNGFKEIHLLALSINQMIHSIKQSQKQIQQKDILLHNQSRFASMGEMIGNIAHQWRQPLNALSITIQKMQRYYEMGKLDEETLNKSIDKSMNLIQKMSSTVDDFMGFFREDKIKISFDVSMAIDETISLLEASIKNNFINLDFKKPSKEITILGYKGEFTQVILNIISNAKDAIKEKNIQNPQIDINLQDQDGFVYVQICDNAGGIPNEIIDKIFDPYFTTKEEGKGTGIGLYMSKVIIEKNMEGNLSIYNTDQGACFVIKLPHTQ